MRRRRLPHAPLPPQGGEARLSEETARHARVLRLRRGDRLVLFDGRGREADATVLRCDEREVRCLIDPPRPADSRPLPAVHLLVAPPKGERLDALVRMTTEAGVASIRLLHTERTVVRWPPDRATRKLARLERVAREAARQCGRVQCPTLAPPLSLSHAVEEMAATAGDRDALRLVLLPDASTWLHEALRLQNARSTLPPDCWLAVGPEGGFSEQEARWFIDEGWTAARLGPHVLRVETAATVAVAGALAALVERYGAHEEAPGSTNRSASAEHERDGSGGR